MKISSSETVLPKNQLPKAPIKALKAAQDFESIFTSMMLKSMRKTIFKDGLLPKSTAEDMYTDMLDQEYAKRITHNASFGLAEKIVKQIGNSATDKDLKTLAGIGRNSWVSDLRFIPQRKTLSSFSTILKKISQYDTILDEVSHEFGVDKSLLTAVIAQESAGDPNAQSKKGAKGLMQLLDSTAKDMGVANIFNPRDNIRGGTKYLTQLLRKFKGDETLALASYNAGPGTVDKYGGVPPYRETQEYVKRIRKIKEQLDNPMNQ